MVEVAEAQRGNCPQLYVILCISGSPLASTVVDHVATQVIFQEKL